jgi:hypothetical protein
MLLFFLVTIAVLWWNAFGGHAFELQSLAKRIVSLCCSASGCERNWSAFAHVSAIPMAASYYQ